MNDLVRYRTRVEDSARWEGFPFRADDIVISAPPKSGTTWMQTLCAMLVLGGLEFGRPLADISPWLDMQTNNRAEVVASLEAQEHRRFIKTHTPLDGVPFAEGVTYVCMARDPRDVALSFQHHWANLDLDAFMAARARAVGLSDLKNSGRRQLCPRTRWNGFGCGWMPTQEGSSAQPWSTCCITWKHSGTAVTIRTCASSITATSWLICPVSFAASPMRYRST